MTDSLKQSELDNNLITRIDVRAHHQQCALIDKAAERLNKTRSEFMLEAACRSAEEVLLDKQHFVLTEPQWERFWAILDAPPNPSPALQQLLRTPAPWES